MDPNVYLLEKWVDSRLADARRVAADAALRAALGAHPEGGVIARSWRALKRVASAVWAGSADAGAPRPSTATRA